MAKKKIDITITLKDGIPKPTKFKEKGKIKREMRLGEMGDYGITTIFDSAGESNLFIIKVGLVDKVEVK